MTRGAGETSAHCLCGRASVIISVLGRPMPREPSSRKPIIEAIGAATKRLTGKARRPSGGRGTGPWPIRIMTTIMPVRTYTPVRTFVLSWASCKDAEHLPQVYVQGTVLYAFVDAFSYGTWNTSCFLSMPRFSRADCLQPQIRTCLSIAVASSPLRLNCSFYCFPHPVGAGSVSSGSRNLWPRQVTLSDDAWDKGHSLKPSIYPLTNFGGPAYSQPVPLYEGKQRLQFS